MATALEQSQSGGKVTLARALPHQWTEEEIAFLKANYTIHGPYWCSLRLGIPRYTVSKFANKTLGLYHGPQRSKKEIYIAAKLEDLKVGQRVRVRYPGHGHDTKNTGKHGINVSLGKILAIYPKFILIETDKGYRVTVTKHDLIATTREKKAIATISILEE